MPRIMYITSSFSFQPIAIEYPRYHVVYPNARSKVRKILSPIHLLTSGILFAIKYTLGVYRRNINFTLFLNIECIFRDLRSLDLGWWIFPCDRDNVDLNPVWHYTNMPCQWGQHDGMLPRGRMVFPRAEPEGKPSSWGETFHHVTLTGMAYLFYYTEQTPFVI